MLRKNPILLARDMEVILRKFVYEQFLSRKFRSKLPGNGEITLVSRRHGIISLINIVNSKINVTFEKNTNLKRYYTNIHVNNTSIIIENEFSVYNAKTEKTIDKRAYTEISYDKIITYSQSKVICSEISDKIYTKEELYYDNLRDILNSEIIMCISKICKYIRE